MKLKWLTVIIATLFLVPVLSAQNLSGTFKLDGVHVQYYDVARDSGVADADVGSTHELVLSWPSAASPMFQYPVADYPPGDTIAAPATPDMLMTPEGLAYVGIDLTLTFNTDGSFQIPTSTYPTTSTENCSTFASIPTIQDAGTYEWDGVDSAGGFGVVESNIFDLFTMNQADLNHGWITINRDESGIITDFILEWVATDGNDSQSGIDTEGNLNRQMGVPTLPADSQFVAGLNTTYGLDLPVGTYPTAGENWEFDTEFNANWMYLFDPAGPDGYLFDYGPDGIPGTEDDVPDDSPLQFTSYYFTYNDMYAIGIFTTVFEQYYGQTGDMEASVDSAANATLVTFGVDSAVAAGVSTTIYDYVAALLSGGMDLDDALVGGMVYAIGAAMEASGGTWIFPDDSDHDYNPIDGNGRLIFELGNQCIPETQTRIVWASFYNIEVSVDSEEGVPTSFTLLGNYPNPFNPETNIVFDLDIHTDVTVTVYSILGQEINTLYRSPSDPGRYTIPWHGKDASGNAVPSGVYFYKVKAGNRVLTGKMLLLK